MVSRPARRKDRLKTAFKAPSLPYQSPDNPWVGAEFSKGHRRDDQASI
jgi:hypothetical protein